MRKTYMHLALSSPSRLFCHCFFFPDFPAFETLDFERFLPGLGGEKGVVVVFERVVGIDDRGRLRTVTNVCDL
jgi:hypothetical protein